LVVLALVCVPTENGWERAKKFQTKKVKTLMSQNNQTLIEHCPTEALAQGSEVLLGVYGEVEVD